MGDNIVFFTLSNNMHEYIQVTNYGMLYNFHPKFQNAILDVSSQSNSKLKDIFISITQNQKINQRYLYPLLLKAPSRYLFLVLFAITLITILCNCSFGTGFALSPSFSQQEIKDFSNDGLKINGANISYTTDKYNDLLNKATDIQSVDYSSDGKNFNATLWLQGKIPSNFELSKVSRLIYGMLIDADSNQATGKDGVDYQVEIQWNNISKTWYRFFDEYSSQGYTRELNKDINYTQLYKEDEQHYVLLSANLSAMNFPNKYKVIFYSEIIYDINDLSNQSIDFTNWADIPAPQFTLSTIPNPLILRVGETKDIGVQLKPLSSGSRVVNFIPNGNTAVQLRFNPDKLNESYNETQPAPFKIHVPQSAPVGQYIIPIIANISTESLFPSKFFFPTQLKIPAHGYVTGSANLTITVLESQSMLEQFKDFWDVFGQPISIIAGGFAGGATSLLFDKLKKPKERKENNNT